MEKENENVRKVTRLGKFSVAVTLPADMVRELGWKEKQKLVAKRIPGGIAFHDFRSKE